jgi:hypothetical protein
MPLLRSPLVVQVLGLLGHCSLSLPVRRAVRQAVPSKLACNLSSLTTLCLLPTGIIALAAVYDPNLANNMSALVLSAGFLLSSGFLRWAFVHCSCRQGSLI